MSPTFSDQSATLPHLPQARSEVSLIPPQLSVTLVQVSAEAAVASPIGPELSDTCGAVGDTSYLSVTGPGVSPTVLDELPTVPQLPPVPEQVSTIPQADTSAGIGDTIPTINDSSESVFRVCNQILTLPELPPMLL